MYSNLIAILFGLLWTAPAIAAPATGDYPTQPNPGDDPFKPYTISAKGIEATLIPYGATLTSLLVNDRNGEQQDVAVGYDDPKQYQQDVQTVHSYFGCIVGRYANRIKNGTFELDGVKYDITKNEIDDTQTLHGGVVGYDQRPWSVENYTDTSVTFSLLDNAFEGFPGDVITYATYSVSSDGTEDKDGQPTLTAKTESHALSDKTPIMLAHHIYWNLNAFKAHDVLEDTTLHLPLSKRFIPIDSNSIPTGEIEDVASVFDGALDFTEPKLVGKDIESAKNCGADCTGYDNAFIIDRAHDKRDETGDDMAVSLNMASSITGISMQVATNQRAVQIYSCNGQDGTIPVKPSQVKRNEKDEGATDVINKYGCIVIETEGWIDGINNPQWEQDKYQIFSADTGPAVNLVTFTFGNDA
ncbi:hypothetical protein AJ79_04510 [Helicocarpus griseus UAMH5409]|uniref:Aldose 1-epimerase n=1 Tax=Helicocarpus griseus UAMH5409 TaxID=1447875 RepID=A0A2B7XTA6_9EURO|nr:hypothetical protein AJ79_04510 [Helicocarpus griseus UAMH5409]